MMEVVLAENVPVPEMEHVGYSGIEPLDTVSVRATAVPLMVPDSVPVYVGLRGLETVNWPETEFPLCVAVHVTGIAGPPCEPGIRAVPDQAPARLRIDGSGAAFDPPQAVIETTARRAPAHATRLSTIFAGGIIEYV